jgi:DNA-binding response OmpR family regulator
MASKYLILPGEVHWISYRTVTPLALILIQVVCYHNGDMSAKKSVLVVDDEPAIGNVLRIKLRLSGYDVITTTSGAEAIEIIVNQPVDIVLLDILMPGVTGMDVLEKVRTFSQVPIIVFTGNEGIAGFAMESGADGSIPKPFNPDEIILKIESVLGRADNDSAGD